MPIPRDPHLARLALLIVQSSDVEPENPHLPEFIDSVATLDYERLKLIEEKVYKPYKDAHEKYDLSITFAIFGLTSSRLKGIEREYEKWERLFKEGSQLVQRKLDEDAAKRKHELDLAQEQSRHLERIEELKLETERVKLEALKLQSEVSHQNQISLKEVESRLRIAESQNIQPIEVQKLLIQAMGRYGEMREKALDEAIRNPALRDQLRARAMAYQEMQLITRETIDGVMSSSLPDEAKKTLMAEYTKRMGQHTEDYLKQM